MRLAKRLGVNKNIPPVRIPLTDQWRCPHSLLRLPSAERNVRRRGLLLIKSSLI